MCQYLLYQVRIQSKFDCAISVLEQAERRAKKRAGSHADQGRNSKRGKSIQSKKDACMDPLRMAIDIIHDQD
jgi:hypothetical protein